MAIKNRELSTNLITQVIDLSEAIGREPTAQEAADFIAAAKERIIERTQSGVNVNGGKFKQYTPEYANFKGVGRGDVDLTFFGDMLDALDGFIDDEKVVITIAGEQAAKAYGHITGFEGHPTIPNGKYKRDFFGLNGKEIDDIANSVKSFDRISDLRQNNEIDTILQRIGLSFGEGEDNGP